MTISSVGVMKFHGTEKNCWPMALVWAVGTATLRKWMDECFCTALVRLHLIPADLGSWWAKGAKSPAQFGKLHLGIKMGSDRIISISISHKSKKQLVNKDLCGGLYGSIGSRMMPQKRSRISPTTNVCRFPQTTGGPFTNSTNGSRSSHAPHHTPEAHGSA